MIHIQTANVKSKKVNAQLALPSNLNYKPPSFKSLPLGFHLLFSEI